MVAWGIAIVLGLLATGAFALFLSRRIEHGEARFDASGAAIEDQQIDRVEQTDRGTVTPGQQSGRRQAGK